ncbi:MAG: hypothetical protein KKE44_22530 [Proteobacteria bacterium]|nr:hypothetical protein [Pseudomonadota bacterium]MBU1585510.1 hypothetical protein [Pseudomonadota bacterium]MBU2453854.1 hypothetical protein [Pseudomonadota bacterium]MBU2630612.1 hypothetical protein [Pseudomonadota bacterium]
MKYIYLTGSIIFAITGISQAMRVLMGEGSRQVVNTPVVFNLQYITLSFMPTPGFVKILLLGLGFFCLFLIRQRLKKLGVGKIWKYIPY